MTGARTSRASRARRSTTSLREMTAPEGGFYSATDADSDGRGGHVLRLDRGGDSRACSARGPATRRFVALYGVTRGGNFEGREHPRTSPRADDDTERAALAPARARQLYAARAQRGPRPLRDDKILAAWNGLMISALARGGARARRAALRRRRRARGRRSSSATCAPGGRLARSCEDGRAGAAGFLDDYAFLVAGLLDLYEATFERALAARGARARATRPSALRRSGAAAAS